ncbi:MAG: AtpZ/AtpI family protein [bacterium]|nr:AtpZ/AtpI family protein [bacterium]
MEEKSEGKPKMMKSTLLLSHHLRVTAMVALITICSVSLLGYGGWRLDDWFSTSPLFLIIGLIISFPLSQFAIYRWIKNHHIPFLKKQD